MKNIKHAMSGVWTHFAARPRVKRLARALVLLFIAIDQLLNVLSNPFSEETWADETLSSRCGRLGHRNPYKFWARIIDAFFHPFQGPNHCRNAYEKEKTGYHFPPSMRHVSKGDN